MSKGIATVWTNDDEQFKGRREGTCFHICTIGDTTCIESFLIDTNLEAIYLFFQILLPRSIDSVTDTHSITLEKIIKIPEDASLHFLITQTGERDKTRC